MKRRCLTLLIAALLAWLALALPGLAEAVEAAGEEGLAEWTVMFYFCGSDLESRYGFATGNLMEIYECDAYSNILVEMAEMYGKKADTSRVVRPGRVNVLIETGGSGAWHMDREIMDVDEDSLQRWSYTPSLETYDVFKLEQTLPLASMADPETLSDFVRWGAQTAPAKKYALVLWDHGGGSKNGLFVDELFGGDILYLYELRSALATSGVHLEAVLMDACMMANLETAWAIHESANWMIASEEVVAGQGTAVKYWLQELYNDPSVDGLALGRNICDMTQMKYADTDNEQARQIMTWSVIDLSRIERVLKQFDLFYKVLDNALTDYPVLVHAYAILMADAEEYGDGLHGMRDLGYLFYEDKASQFFDYALRRDMLDALREAVPYVVRGAGRAWARGLSFCYAADFEDDELAIYERNCPSAHYLAFLSAVSGWEASDWVYENAMRLPAIGTLEGYKIKYEKRWSDDGIPALYVKYNEEGAMRTVLYTLYRKDDDSGRVMRLGGTLCVDLSDSSEEGTLDGPNALFNWPHIDGQPCSMDLVNVDLAQSVYVFNIPIQLGRDKAILRCGRWFGMDETAGVDMGDFIEYPIMNRYELFGVWDGYDEDIGMPNRNIRSLSQVAGQEYQLLYPMGDFEEDSAGYEMSPTLTMYRALDIGEKPLSAGTYYLEYEIYDIFGRSHLLDRIEIHWDGQKMTFPEDFVWEGEETLSVTD